MSHVDEGTLHTYLDGELSGAEAARLAAHLAECAVCRAHLEEEQALVHRARDLLALAAPPPPRARRRARAWDKLRLPLAWAATVAIAFAVGRYVEGARPGQEPAAERAVPVVVAPPVAVVPPASIPRVANVPRREVAPAPTPAMAQDIVPPPSEAALDVDSARRLLGQAPALLPGVPVQRVTQAQDGIVVEQQLASGAVVRLYERPAQDIRPSPAAKIAQQRSALPAPAFGAAQAGGSPAGERLARYVGSLRVEITGPLPEDSLSRLLELVK